VPPDQPGELKARQENWIEIHDNPAGTESGHRTQILGIGRLAIGAPVYRSHTMSNQGALVNVDKVFGT
jgi:hypothetical protein